jgi:uncharacterized protein (TIGR00251 family)
MHKAIRVVDNGVVLRIRVIPGASKTALCEYDDWRNSLRIKTKEPALKGAANLSLEGFFSSLFGKEAAIVSGARSKDKEVLVLGTTLSEAEERLAQFCPKKE